jgi:hypothetical protein
MMSASAATTWKTSLPPCAVVSSRSCSEVKPISRMRGSLTMSMRSCRLPIPGAVLDMSKTCWLPFHEGTIDIA